MNKNYKTILLNICCVLLALQIHAQTVVTFTASGTYTVPSNVISISVEVVGAGGAGGSNGGCGGGGGGYASKTFTVAPSTSYTVTVGASQLYYPAGSTSFGNLIYATGGAAGPSGGTAVGGNGGQGFSGTINNTGGKGGTGQWT